jgi:arylsulfatase A-like enzyme
MISRREFVRGGAALGAGRLINPALPMPSPSTEDALPGKAAAGSPNVLIFMPDQQNGATILPGSPVHTPNIQRFLQGAVAFTSAHCPAPHCCPSRASFMSGLYPSEHGVFNNVTTDTAIHPNPYPETPFWGRWLKAAGYSMGYAGKLHVGRDITPESCGFENLCPLEQDSLPINLQRKAEQWQQARTESTDPRARRDGEILRPEWTNLQLYNTLPNAGPKGYEGLPDYHIVQAGITSMKRMAVGSRPWCIMVSNSGAHDSYDAPQRFVDMYDLDGIELPASFHDTLDDKPRVYQRQRYQYWSQLSDRETRDALRHYYAKCSMQDAMFGELLQALDETGQRENTIVIYVSDHGDYRAAHGLWMKGVPSFREAYHIPAVVSWPRGIKNPGRQIDALVDQVDWAPTILEACGVAPAKKLSGRSVMPWLRDESPADWREATFTQMNGVELYYTQRITMTKNWKYVYNGFDYDELYDLKNDPHEMRNLAFPDLTAMRGTTLKGAGLSATGHTPWPMLAGELESVRKELLAKMWTFAAQHNDIIFNPYGTVALAPLGPGLSATAPDAAAGTSASRRSE